MIDLKGEILEKKNLSKTPANTFEFAEEDLRDTLASWHTHPSGEATLSGLDFYFFKSWTNRSHFIISSTEVRCYVSLNGVIYLVEQEKDHPAWTPSG